MKNQEAVDSYGFQIICDEVNQPRPFENEIIEVHREQHARRVERNVAFISGVRNCMNEAAIYENLLRIMP